MPKTTGSHDRLKRLKGIISGLAPVIVSFSGGADSSFLLWVCAQILPVNEVTAITFCSATTPTAEMRDAKAIAASFHVEHIIYPGPEMQNEEFLANDLLRCYYCKRERFTFLLSLNSRFTGASVIEGSVIDDLEEYRPGMKALKEAGVVSPLLDAGISKNDIKVIGAENGLSLINKKSESCLATRIKHGQRIEPAVLEQIQTAEAALHNMGFQLVRVRYNGGEARLEFEAGDFEKALILRREISLCLQKCGFTNAALDLEGYKKVGKEKS